MPKKLQRTKDLKGLFIYHDEHHGTVYYDIISRNGYILTNQDLKYYTLSIAFLPLAVILFYLLLQIKLSTVTSLLISLAFYVLAHIIYRIAFLYRLPCVKNYSAKKPGGIIDNLTNTYSKPRLAVLAIFATALVILTAAYALTSDFTGLALYALWALVGATFIFLLVILIAYIKKNKNQ